ncbi:MAG TPA: GTP-binding protein [Aliidongia sp.]|uniref:GTP-binding protein n=1 Tax=Aliidongia sp. TaxID=1914230 RepID=UPI002DDCBF3F|nr:GTP-binding protein [Aliidongia sp.]HEV2675347.1 GTP-binding protein [Aliidongia sp.]
MARTIPLDRYRNIGILARLDAGRTTVTERILAVTDRPDPAAEGARAALGLPAWVEQDNERQITLTSAATSCVWQDCRITIVELSAAGRKGGDRALGVLDGAVLVIDGAVAVTDGVAALFEDTDAQGLARLVFVNKLDREGADLFAVVAAIAARGTAKPVLLQLPIGAGAGLRGIVDLVEMRATLWRDAGHDALAEEVEIPADLLAAAEAARAEIGLAVGETGTDVAMLRQAVKKAVRSGSIVPVLCGSAFRNRGVRRLLDAVVDYLPAPSDLAAHAGVAADGNRVERRPADDEPFSGVAFQTVDDPMAGRLTFVRIYSGVVATGGNMLNSVTASPEKIGRMVRMHANHTEEIKEARAGDIIALAGLEHTTTGDTLCDPDAPVILGRMPATAGRAKH